MFSHRTVATLGAGALVVTALVVPAGVATAAPAAPHAAAPTIEFTGGYTALKLNASTASALTAAGVKVTPTGPSYVRKNGKIAFPITAGSLNSKSLAGHVYHSGGLRFTAGGKSLLIRNFIINPASDGLTANVKQAGVRIKILKLHLKDAKVKATKHLLTISRVDATLGTKAAKALDAYFGTTLFQPGLAIGTAYSRAHIYLS